MSKSKTMFLAALLALLTLSLLLAPDSALAKKGGKHQAKAKGTITALDTTGGTVTIHDRKSDQDVTVTVDENTRIHKDNVEGAALTDLAVGDKADARYDPATFLAKRIQAKSPRVKLANFSGKLSAIDLAPATLADFVIGDQGHAKYNPNTFEAAKLHASGE